MKKIIFISFLMLSFVFGLNAQTTLATFEEGDTDLAVFGTNDTGGGGFWFDAACFIESGQPQVGNNPAKGGINTSDKCLLAVNVADADWWGNFCSIGLAEPITITEENRYLHFMAYRSIQPKNFRVNANGTADGGNGGGNTELWNGKLKQDATWEWVVIDLGALIEKDEQLSVISFVLSNNWDDPRTGWDVATYAFDNFALGNSSLPPDVTLLDGSQLHIGFESSDETGRWVKEIDVIDATNAYSIVDNPFTASEVNSGGKVLKFDKSADASWWKGCRLDFNGIMPAGGDNPQYLHALVYIPATVLEDGMTGIDVQLCAKDHLGNEDTEVFTVWDDEAGEWIDLVLEVNAIEYLKEVTVRYDVRKDAEGDEWINSPANTFYLDEIVFNNDEAARTYIETGIKQTLIPALADITASDGTIYIKANKNAQIQVYNVVGQLLQSVQGLSHAEFPAEKGVYIVNVKIGAEKQTAKVLVK